VQRRAVSVSKRLITLITRKGLASVRVSGVFYGASVPLSDNATAEGRHQNRRVEILVYKEEITSPPRVQRLDLQRSGKAR
jgi:flagellar motor protein MotB